MAVAPARVASLDDAFRDHQPWLVQRLALVVGDAEEARDLAQQTFVRALYAYDSANRRIVAFSKKSGAFIGQFMAPSDTPWFSALTGMFVTTDAAGANPKLYWTESGNLMSAALKRAVNQTPSESVAPASSKPSASAAPNSPQASPRYVRYLVMAGDSLAVIEVRFGLQQFYLELANPQVDFNHLTVGQVLNIPLTGSLTPPTASPGST